MHRILVRVNPENADGAVSILHPSGEILQSTAKVWVKKVVLWLE